MSEAGFEAYKNQRSKNYVQMNLTILFVTVGIIAFFYFEDSGKKAKHSIDLESISFEAKKMGAQDSDSYLQFSSEKVEEIETFLSDNPKVRFQARILKNLPEQWKIKGASVIDYGKEKVLVSLYKKNSGEKVYVFTFKDKGKIKQGELSVKGKIRYSLHASKDINMLVWKTEKETINVMAGWQSTNELTEFF